MLTSRVSDERQDVVHSKKTEDPGRSEASARKETVLMAAQNPIGMNASLTFVLRRKYVILHVCYVAERQEV